MTSELINLIFVLKIGEFMQVFIGMMQNNMKYLHKIAFLYCFFTLNF